MAFSAKARISLIARGARFLKLTPWHYNQWKEGLQLVFRPNAIWERSRIPIPARISSGSAIEVDFIKLISSSCRPCQPGRKILTGSCEKACQGPLCKEHVKIPLPIVRLSNVFFFRGRMRWCGCRVFRRKGREHISAFKFPFSHPSAHTH